MKPKHPVTAYFLFSSERRAALLADNKNVLEVTESISIFRLSLIAEFDFLFRQFEVFCSLAGRKDQW